MHLFLSCLPTYSKAGLRLWPCKFLNCMLSVPGFPFSPLILLIWICVWIFSIGLTKCQPFLSFQITNPFVDFFFFTISFLSPLVSVISVHLLMGFSCSYFSKTLRHIVKFVFQISHVFKMWTHHSYKAAFITSWIPLACIPLRGSVSPSTVTDSFAGHSNLG